MREIALVGARTAVEHCRIWCTVEAAGDAVVRSAALFHQMTVPSQTEQAEITRWRGRYEAAKLKHRGATGAAPMCDYSLETVKTRPARVGDKVVTHRFWSATGGFCAPEDIHLAVCLLPGTEMSFAFEVKRSGLWPWSKNIIHHKTAIFRQVNLDCPHAHHDALEFPDGEIVLLTYLMEGQEAVVLQLPATGSKTPQRAAYV